MREALCLAAIAASLQGQACGAVGFEKASKMVLRFGPPDPAAIARGEQDFYRFAAVLNRHLKERKWLTGSDLTIADFSLGAWVPSANLLQLPIAEFPEIMRWYDGLASLPAWAASLGSRPS
jgi:glutathione S-transferase